MRPREESFVEHAVLVPGERASETEHEAEHVLRVDHRVQVVDLLLENLLGFGIRRGGEGGQRDACCLSQAVFRQLRAGNTNQEKGALLLLGGGGEGVGYHQQQRRKRNPSIHQHPEKERCC